MKGKDEGFGLCVVHGDLDGVVSGWIISRFYGMLWDGVILAQYQEVDAVIEGLLPKLGDKGKLFVADITPGSEMLARIAAVLGSRLWLLDHHKTVKETLEECAKAYPESNIFYRPDTCAALGVLHELKVDSPHPWHVAQVVDAWDRWLLASEHREESEELNAALSSMPVDRFANMLMWSKYKQLIDRGRLMLEAQQHVIDELVSKVDDSGFFTDSCGRMGLAVLVSDAAIVSKYADALLMKYRSRCDYVMLINLLADTVNLRSLPGVDVSEIAVKYGGGGHANAAGYGVGLKEICVGRVLSEMGVR
jgi:oligoribonuclease NrnB/cAMP/cGMP phosphodiesterase (DHH superfamily)